VKKLLFPDRYFDPDPVQRRIARELFEGVAGLPIVCPHGHVEPRLLGDPDATFGTPAQMLIIADHYVLRMLYSRGIPMEALGIRPRSLSSVAGALPAAEVERDHRRIWQTFADHFWLFRGTPTGIWISHELQDIFFIDEKLSGGTAQSIYDQLEARLALPEFRPRALFERFGIETLCTTDSVADDLAHHRAIRASGWAGDVRPTYRPDSVVNLFWPGWRQEIEALGAAGGLSIHSYAAFLQALEARRDFFREMGAVATDHSAETPHTGELDVAEAEAIFQRALRGQATAGDATRFTGHMFMEFARMSIEDGLVMQLHCGSIRNYNEALFARFGPDMGADIPRQTEFSYNLRPLLQKFGNDPRLRLILFTLDESTYSRELAPLVGHYPALRLGPPWWFHDSFNGMRRYFDRVVETAGLQNTCGFNDDTRAFPSIPVRHDLWRRAACNWIAGLVVRHLVDMEDAREMAADAAYRLVKDAYRLGDGPRPSLMPATGPESIAARKE
jgi:glucuronate isomerase